MAKMLGKRGLEHHRDGGDDIIPKSTIRKREDQEWMKDFVEEVIPEGDHYHWQLGGRS